jgi:heme/copper-type cytochrome/quinol oxidase subunit 1
MAVPPADFLVHNSLFLIAHFHNVIIGGVVFGMFAGIIFYWPKMFGWKLNEAWGKAAFWFWFFGFYFAFMPLYILGFMGMTRRLNTYDNPEWDPYIAIAFFGSVLVAIGIACFLCRLLLVTYNATTTSTLQAIHGMVVHLNGRLRLLLRSTTLLTFQQSMVLIRSGMTKRMA